MSQGVLAPIHDEHLVELTGVHPVTVRRWKKLARIPRWLQRLVRVCLHGELAEIDPAWRGWRLVRGELVSPEGRAFTPGAVRASVLWRARALELGALDRRRRVQIEADPVNRAGIAKLRALELALQSARRAMDDITDGLRTDERNRILCGESQSSGVMRVARSSRPSLSPVFTSPAPPPVRDIPPSSPSPCR